MKTDLLLVPMSARWSDMRAAALAAEAAGFDGLWTWDHLRDHDAPDGPGTPEAWTVLTALAAVTQRLMLGPAIGRRLPITVLRKGARVDVVAVPAPLET